ncbi:vacuole protein [Thalictrum thalictroides]|uniref:Vacuole protein n=1 Tax=Thalictrum thalictroides TaxID=46969 RepID=A0A7J6XDV2_THATH|nr:vacuole protein [Thalictrum thalictroides]
MARTGEEGDIESLQRAPSLPSSRPIRPKQSDPLLIVCKGFSLITCFVAIVCLVVNIISAINSFKTGSDIFNGIFRCYAVALAIFVVVAETEWGFIFKFWRVLEFWAGRGMLQIFVAVMTRAYPDISGKWKNVVLLQDIASYMLLSCGVIYIVSGVMCIGFLKRARQHKEISREQAVRDLEQLERRREELEQLLITHRT